MTLDGSASGCISPSMTTTPIILWFRRDLRIADNPMLHEAAASGRPILPVFIHDHVVETAPVAPRWRWGLGIGVFAKALEHAGSRLILRRGPAAEVLIGLARETGARDVWWARHYDPAFVARDREVEDALTREGILARTFGGWVMHEPWEVETKSGGFYKVYTPYWRAVRDREVPQPLPAPSAIPAPRTWPTGEEQETWGMGAAMRRGADVVAKHVVVGETAARERLDRFVAERLEDYDDARDRPAAPGTSGLSENLTYGEVSPRTVWHAALGGADPMAGLGAGTETFLKELVWREYAYHLLHHTPHLADRNWKPDWDAFPWRGDSPEAEAWRRGRTGVRFVDAAMREMWVTGTMHNRGRLVTASFLTKHLLTHWKIGCDFFADHLIDWDVANNALNWQWVAGSGPDASPFFRVFNPVSQEERFDPKGGYARHWIAEGAGDPSDDASSFHQAVPRSWNLRPDGPYPDPVVPLSAGRQRALDALGEYRAGKG